MHESYLFLAQTAQVVERPNATDATMIVFVRSMKIAVSTPRGEDQDQDQDLILFLILSCAGRAGGRSSCS